MANKGTDWPALWRQMKVTLLKHGAPQEVVEAVDRTEWTVRGNTFFLYCPKILYQWIEVPASATRDANLRFVKPIIWPAMQRLGCSTLIYKLL